MKKPYVKPQVYFENFQLSASIALGCKLLSHAAENVCPVDDPDLGVKIFMETIGCSYTPGPGDEKPCYDPPADSTRVFSS